ncbi:MAG: DUF2231 domain-containing protein [Lysobacteraceae bacterium]
MPRPHEKPIPSRVAFKQHPLHPMMVHFPIAFLGFVPLADALFWWQGDPFWAQMAFWMIVAGFGMGVIASILGTADFLLVRAVRQHVAGWSHFIAAIMALSLAGTNLMLRFDDPVGAALPWGLFTSLATLVVLGFAGWLGGTLTFRHGIGTYVHTDDGDDGGEDDAPEDPVRE